MTAPITLTIDGIRLSVPAGTLVIRAAERLGIAIPRFCDHPLLDPAGACRQCLIEVEGLPKPMASCTTVATDGMVVRTQLTSSLAAGAQRGVMELLLINHPLDCPMCDKGGECPLQNQAMSGGRGETRYTDDKRTFPKPIPLSPQLLLDRERCVQCARCTRFADQIAGDPSLELLERGASQQVGVADGRPFDSYFSGNTVQICPVGALTAASYRFGSRPFGLASSPSVCEHCASGCALRTDRRNGRILRRLAGEDPEVNEEWNCDKGRWAFRYVTRGDRLNHPRVRDGGEQEVASWPVALGAAGRGLAGARWAAVLTGGRLTLEDAYAYAKFARVALGTNDVDFRARPIPPEEAGFLETRVAGRGLGVTYADLERAPIVLLAGLEPEEEAPIVFLRLRKAARRGGTVIAAVAPYVTPGLARLSARVLRARPGAEPHILTDLADADIHSSGNQDCHEPCGKRENGLGGVPPEAGELSKLSELLRRRGAIILVGERLSAAPGALSAAARLADHTGAALAWIPRRAGDRGALEAGAFPTLLPGGHPVTDPLARADVAAVWNVRKLPPDPGRDTGAILRAAADGAIDALVIAGVDLDDLPDPDAARRAIERVPFVVSLELRRGPITDLADVVFPVAATPEKAGTYVNWEGRHRSFEAALRGVRHLTDLRVLNSIAGEMGRPLGLPATEAVRRELAALRTWTGDRPAPSPVAPPRRLAAPAGGEAALATWRMLLDDGRMQAGETHLAEAARRPVARLSAATADEIGVADGDPVTVGTDRGAVTLPLVVTEMPERVVWVPARAHGRAVHRELGATAGAIVRIEAGDP